MALEKCAPRTSYVDVLDRVLDKGLVIDAWLRVSVAGLTLVNVDARVVVASIGTYIKSSVALGASPIAAPSSASAPAALMPREARRRRRPAGRPRTFYRCQHGCTFALDRRAREATVACPFDGGRACALTPAPLV